MTPIEPSCTALVLIDRIDRIVALPLAPLSGADVVRNATRPADAFLEAPSTRR